MTCLQLTTTEAYKISHFVYITLCSMPTRLQKKRAQNKKYYIDHKEKLTLQACKNYAANSDFKKCASKEYCETHKEHTIVSIMKPTKSRERRLLHC